MVQPIWGELPTASCNLLTRLRGEYSLSLSQGRLHRCCHLDPHERTTLRSKQEFRIDERVEQDATRRFVEAPEPACLRLRNTHPRHFHELALHSPHHFVIRSNRL